jgi:GTP pyrophosphokinase
MVTVHSKVPKGAEITDADLNAWLQSIAAARTPRELEVIRQACTTVAQAYGDRVRPSGEPAVLHALSVADILIGLDVDHETISAAILHSVLEDAVCRKEGLVACFGQEICHLVESATYMGHVRAWQLERASSVARDAAQVEVVRRMLLAMAEDVRVVLIRLADELHDLRASRFLPEEQRHQIAREALEIYAPLANRLGIGQLKWELEDLAFRTLEPQTYGRVAGLLDERRLDREDFIRKVIGRLRLELASAGIRAEIYGRPKHIYSIWRKMQRKGVSFDRIFDVRAVRILVSDIAACYGALGIVHALWKPIRGEFDDYIASPKENLYQSLHTAVLGPDAKTLEVQIRTQEMHEHAELGVAAHWRYKEARTKSVEYDKRITWMRRLLAWKGDPSEAGDFLEDFRTRITQDRVFVFTPMGKTIDLPAGSHPLDFAYAVHTDVGHRCRGAKVNGRIVNLTYELKSGDTVEVLTAPGGGPSRDWLLPHLNFLATARARAKVRQWFKRQNYAENVVAGKASLEQELQRLGVHREKVDFERLMRRFHVPKLDDLLAAIGRGEISTVILADALGESAPERDARRAVFPSPGRSEGAGEAGGVKIMGVGDLLTQIARCCKPVPGDSVIGFITRGHGVTIHRCDCLNVLRVEAADRARFIEVEWSTSPKSTFPVDIQVQAYDRTGLIRDVTSVFSTEHINVLAMQSASDKRHNSAHMAMTIEVADMGQLVRVLDKIDQLPNVIEARRRF